VTTGPARVSLTAPAKAQYLACFRLVLVGLARAGGFGEETLSDLKLAVTEAASNVVRHAYAETGGTVTARFELGADFVAVAVEDGGAGFELEHVPAPEGLGLSIIRALTEDLAVARGANGRGTTVSFRKAF
jgi:serine/threonine-protein kinase RsbW